MIKHSFLVGLGLALIACSGGPAKPATLGVLKDSISPDKEISFHHAGKTVITARDGQGIIMHRYKNVPQVGEMAPDFHLKLEDGSDSIWLNEYCKEKPVVLLFGSFT